MGIERPTQHSETKENAFSLFEKCLQEADSIVLEYDKDGRILAPNGLPSELQNETLCKVVRTKAFREWFGDWERRPFLASKAVYESTGEPRIVYHSSIADIPLEEGLKSSYDRGQIFFSDNAEESFMWAQRASDQLAGRVTPPPQASMYPCFVKLNWLTGSKGERVRRKDHGNVYGGDYSHYVVMSRDQVMHIPFNLVENNPKPSNES